MMRWYFSDAQECRQFLYRGVGGNENNFLTKRECEKECISTMFLIFYNLITVI